MTSPIDRFDEAMAVFDDAALARLDAELDARRNDPIRPAPQSRLRDEVRDPFGMDWAWADARNDEAKVALTSPSRAEEAPPIVRLPVRPVIGGRPRLRRFGFWLATAAAACLLVALGTLLGGRLIQGSGRFLVATAVVPLEARGQVPQLEVTSNRDGFVTVIALLPGRAQRPAVFPVSPTPDLGVGPDSPANTGDFPPEASTATVALVVVTRTPAADTIDKALLNTSFSVDQVDRLQEFVAELLRSKGHEQFAIDRIPLGQEQP